MDGRHRAAACGARDVSHQGRNGACTDAPDPSSRRRPESEEVFAAAVELATSGAGAFRRTARRYSICAADADDAYQRSLEILLTKAPTADRSELRPWLHTVIKHEALAAAAAARAHPSRPRTPPPKTGRVRPRATRRRRPATASGFATPRRRSAR